MNKILALDPSLSSTGYALINSEDLSILTKGRIITKKDKVFDNTDDRIQDIVYFFNDYPIFNDLDAVILEDGFIGKNIKGSMNLAQLRGALISFFKYRKYNVLHMQPKEIRKNFRLPGNATKEQVATEVLKYYPDLISDIGPYSDKSNKNKTSDIYDAIATGLSYIINLKG